MRVRAKRFWDERGFFMETYSKKVFENLGITDNFVQDNHSMSSKGVLRGLHYQLGREQVKLVRVVAGSVFDVAVDIRKGSPTFGKWFGTVLSGDNKRQMYIPAGLAHGFYTLGDNTEFLYKCTDYYAPETEMTILWNDPDLNVDWGIDDLKVVNVSEKDKKGSY